ncbi:YbhB/YbcL family Raf kinase inhibitor-like protein [Neolewinella lacunae]|uniref:YbhB/YbcL family Raf kinase inhibitor-like protein n=1 Tax=Neolewinella lacunae TaxID=1517758 RepID=A0A923PP31_9BACT|nr:YbhB/YbcL family Raf kinase inhibitor-like protein [Neolewinella lacunae]MBC6994072.1 YbhB/YbcL family Raf kinase inhibitor-like protein [Neolewinella lacunae]MDN3636057.1 YbhB/YbcL family Raf kinase inhibitor-like protein [Neolewinella lacunae]
MAGFTLYSDHFSGQVPKVCVFNDFGAGGDNQSPDLRWENAPAGTKSFVLVLHDPDAPTPAGWTHWCAFDIPADTTSLALGASPGALPGGTKETRNSYGAFGYGGPCPPPGDPAHCYHFTLYALSTSSLGLEADTPMPMVVFVAREHILGKAGITAMYAR